MQKNIQHLRHGGLLNILGEFGLQKIWKYQRQLNLVSSPYLSVMDLNDLEITPVCTYTAVKKFPDRIQLMQDLFEPQFIRYKDKKIMQNHAVRIQLDMHFNYHII